MFFSACSLISKINQKSTKNQPKINQKLIKTTTQELSNQPLVMLVDDEIANINVL